MISTPTHLEGIDPDPPPLPARPVLRQRWAELAYFHWPYQPDVVQRLLPPGVTVDTFDGVAWVGLIPFEMRNVQLGPTPPVPWLGSFIEINVRTYVIDPSGRRAVWFFSLDVPRSVVVAVARSIFALPYCWADIEHSTGGGQHRYRSERRWPHRTRPAADIRFNVGRRLTDDQVGDLEHFLCARWALLTSRRDQLLYGRVCHTRWPLHAIDELSIDETMIAAAGLPPPCGAPHAMYSPGVDVEIAWFDKTRPQEAR
jgi:uncharacterized protein